MHPIRFLQRVDVRRDPVKFVGRRMRYEFERRFAPGVTRSDRVIRFDRDLLMEVRLSDPIERAIYLYGFYEFVLGNVFSALLRPGMTVVDAGAHAGEYTLLASRKVGPRGRVLSVEPLPRNRSRLLRNIQLNGLTNVTVVPAALSNVSGSADFFVPDEDPYALASLFQRNGHGVSASRITVTTVTVDSVVKAENIEQIDLMKVDVEGAELLVFEGAGETIARCKPAIVFEINDLYTKDGFTSAPSIDALRDLEYRLYAVRINRRDLWQLAEVLPGEDPRRYREPWLAVNLIAYHPRSSVRVYEGQARRFLT